jgi:integrase
MPRTRSRLYRRKDSPFWWAVWTDYEGFHHRQSTGCRDRSSAATWLATRELERVRGEAGVPVARAINFAAALAEYLAEREPEWSRGWWTAVEGFARNQVVPHFGGDRTVSTISREEVARFRVQQIGRPGRGGKPVKAATVNRLTWALAAFGGWCVERKYSLENPWAKHESFPEDQVPPPVVEGKVFEALLAALENRPQSRFPWRALFEFAHETALRKSELGRLVRTDIDRAERRGWVVSSSARGHNKARRLRSIALSRRALEILDALPSRSDGLVFGPIPDPRRAFAAAAKGAKLDRVWLHLMRHTASTRVGRAGASLADLMGFGGWSSVRMAQRYTHTDHRRQLELVDRASEHARGTREDDEQEAGGSE